MQQIIINDISIDVVRKNIKNIHLSVCPPKGNVRIAVPMEEHEEVIRLFAIAKLAWIKRSRQKFEMQERETERVYKNRESHYFQGKRYLLNVIEQEASSKVVLRNKTYIDLYIRAGTSDTKRHEIMTEWYREQLKQQILPLVKKWEKTMKVSVSWWGIKKMKTKWGACNIQERRIWLNLELAKKPVPCLEYVIVHEMIHLLERYHNDKFYHYMDTHLANWKQLKDELNRLPVSYAEWKHYKII